MKLRAKCKCGAEFEAQGLGGVSLEDYRVWAAIHNTRCYGVKGWDTDDEGKLLVSAAPYDRDANSEP